MPIDPQIQLALDLPLKDKPSIRSVSGKRKRKGGYAATPGTGPQGETCKTCRHIRRKMGGRKSYPKCALVKWTSGTATDIRVHAPACSRWSRPVEGQQPDA
jgi:hypothetical protein